MKRRFNGCNSIFTWIIVAFVLLITPLYIIGIQIFSWSTSMLSEEIFNSMQKEMAFSLNMLENDLNRIKMLQVALLDDDDLTGLASIGDSLDNYNKTKVINRIQQRLTYLRSSSPYIQMASAYIPLLDLSIHASGTSKGSIDKISNNLEKAIEKSRVNPDSLTFYWEDRLLMMSKYPHTISKNTQPKIVIEVELSKDTIKKVMVTSDKSVDSNSIFEIPSQKFLLSSSDDIQTAKEISKAVGNKNEGQKNNAIEVNIKGTPYFVISRCSSDAQIIMSRYIPKQILFKPLEKFKTWYWIFSVFALIAIILYSFSMYGFIQKPIRDLVKAFQIVKQGNFKMHIDQSYKYEFRYLSDGFNDMVKNIEALIEQVYQQKILAQKAELKQLQSQINPHFLFNSFFILKKRILMGEYEHAEYLCDGLGTYFKYITRSASDEVPLIKEVEHARIYTEIQAARFINRIKVEFGTLPTEYEKMIVPRLILQPIIENAFEHGLEETEDNGILKISFKGVQDNELVILVEDNGLGIDEQKIQQIREGLNDCSPERENTGIINTHKRIRIALGEESGIHVSIGELGGLRVEVKLMDKGQEMEG